MTFISTSFLLFLPITFFLYWFVFNKKLYIQNAFLVIASYAFYGWWDINLLAILFGISTCTYSFGFLIEKYQIKHWRKFFNLLNIIICTATLLLFKYYDFFISSFCNIFINGKGDSLLLNLILPAGLSFYIFRCISYTIDIYYGKIQSGNSYINVLAYVSFFPQILSGPIAKPSELIPQLSVKRVFNYATGVVGVRQILWGFFKKIVIADNCGKYVDYVYSNVGSHNGSTILLASIIYSIQIYTDFSGYSDISIGTTKLLGFTSPRNFIYPYFSRNIAEFWRKWHISLTSWFRDYLYIPLGGNKGSKLKIITNTLIVFILSGLWHGASCTFLIWGVVHALLFIPLIISGANKKYKVGEAVRKVSD